MHVQIHTHIPTALHHSERLNNWVNKLLSEDNKVPEHWQGPPHVNKVRQYETVSFLKVSLFIQSFFSD